MRRVLKMRFCTCCGTALEWTDSDQRRRPFCPQCQRIQYDQLKVGAGGLIEQDGRLLLLQRTTAPYEHCWNLPAGYAEADESPVQTAVREVREETGLCVRVEGLADVYFFDDLSGGNGGEKDGSHWHRMDLRGKFKVHRGARLEDLTEEIEFTDAQAEGPCDFYYVRVTQRNGHRAWSSPIWVESLPQSAPVG